MEDTKNISQEEKTIYRKHFNARMWVAFTITLLLVIATIPFSFANNADYPDYPVIIFPALFIGLGIWSLLLWGYVPRIFSLSEYLYKRSYRIFRYRFLPLTEDAEIIAKQRIYKKVNPIWNILIALGLFFWGYLLYLSVMI
ncbi:MAG: hypothetical protein QY321_00450 [Patescibacteria group bacterium]|nr:MAG: hypothetical protein QY321_00450 [Patescibacteria group bacterium]